MTCLTTIGEVILYTGIAVVCIGGLLFRELAPMGISLMAVGAVIHDHGANKRDLVLPSAEYHKENHA